MGKERPGPDPAPPRDGDKVQARQRVNQMVKTGILPRPNDLPCKDCAHEWKIGDKRHEYDHFKGYAAEHHLDVEPVCSPCHAKRDSKKKAQTHCFKGHEFTPGNTFTAKNGTRKCRECRKAYDRNRRDAAWWRNWRSIREKRNGKWVKKQA